MLKIPTDIRTRVSRRAKRMHLRLAPEHFIELVLPQNANMRQAQAFVRDSSDWLQKTRQTLQQRQNRHQKACQQLPAEIEIALDGSHWQVKLDHCSAARGQLSVARPCLSFSINQPSAGFDLLRQWIKQHARALLQPRLQRLSKQTGLPYARLRIGLQKTRWGSCSGKGTISLNAGLVFMPEVLVDYIIIHELCHTHHMNHSPAYWALVESHLPDYRQHDRAMRHARRYLPDWLACR